MDVSLFDVCVLKESEKVNTLTSFNYEYFKAVVTFMARVICSNLFYMRFLIAQ